MNSLRWEKLLISKSQSMQPELSQFDHNQFNLLASLIAQLVKNPPAMQETLVQFLGWEDRQRRNRPPTPVFLGFLYGSAGKESACNAGGLNLIPGLGRSPGGRQGNRLQCSCLEKSMDRGAWQATVPGSGRSPGGRQGNPLQYSCLENPHGQRGLVGYDPWGRRVGCS